MPRMQNTLGHFYQRCRGGILIVCHSREDSQAQGSLLCRRKRLLRDVDVGPTKHFTHPTLQECLKCQCLSNRAVSGSRWVEWGKGYVETAIRESNQSIPVGYVVVHNAWQGAEDCLKGVLVNGGVSFQKRSDHDLNYLIDLIERNRLADSGQVTALRSSVTTVCTSGSATAFRYPENDPQFFETLSKSDIQNRANNARNISDICQALV